MLFNELPTAFPWFDRIEKQTRYKQHADVCDFRLITPRNTMLPFEFRRATIKKKPLTWKIYEVNTNTMVVDLATQITKVHYRTIGAYDYFTFNGETLGLNLPYGFYYSKITFGTGIDSYYSEVFCIPEDDFLDTAVNIKYLKLTWWNSKDMDPFFYSDIVSGAPFFKNVIYLNSFIHASEPEIVEEGTRDGNDEVIPTFQKMSVSYKVSDVVPDFLKNALVAIQLHDNIFLTDSGGFRSGQIKNVTSSTSLEANGIFSTVEISFRQDLVIINKNCNEPIGLDLGTALWS